MSEHISLVEPAREAVARAADVCRQVQRALDTVREITKDDKSPVTVADLASQAIVGRILRERLGEGVRLVAEEDSAFLREPGHRAHLEATLAAVQEVWPEATESDVLEAIDVGDGSPSPDGFWTLDPIDGTKGFLRGQQYAVSLAYILHGEPVVGVLGCPNLPRDFNAPLDEPDPHGCLYFGVAGQGVWEVACDQPDEKPVHIQRLDHAEGEPISVCASVEKEHSSVGDTDRILEHITEHGGEVGEPTRLDSQAKYAVVARGQADAYLRLPTRKDYAEKIWDHAAGSLIAGEARAPVTDIHGRDLDFSHGTVLRENAGIVCAAPRIHGAIIGAIRELGIGAS